jgi:tRNA(fMet)-specific endonuclease VapC
VSFLLDTDICSLHLRGDRRLFGRFVQHLGQLHISTITAAELFVWIRRSSNAAKRSADARGFFRDVAILDFDLAVAEKFGEIRAQQLSAGQFTPELDLLIATTALAHGLTLVTHNVHDFGAVPGLKVVDWLVP